MTQDIWNTDAIKKKAEELKKTPKVAEPKTLQEHLDQLGIDEGTASYLSGVNGTVVARALAGHPISEPHANALCLMLSKQHGLHSQRGFLPEDITGLNIWIPDAKHTKSLVDDRVDRRR